jgi:hypothetical protein
MNLSIVHTIHIKEIGMKIKKEIKDKILTAANALTDEGIESPTNDYGACMDCCQ